MNFFRKSILWKVFNYFILFTVLAAVIVYYFFSQNYQNISLVTFAGVLVFFLAYFLLVYWYEFVRPMNVILNEIRALLMGKEYKRFFSKRIDEIGVIAHFFNEVTRNFEKISNQLREGKRMMGELEIAGQIQKEILPTAAPHIAGLDIVAKTRPAVELGGDNFDFITNKDNTFIYIGDVTGHGVPAALIMMMVNTLIHTLVDVYDSAYDVVVQTNRQLKARIKSTMFMTMLMLKWNSTTQTMSYVGAGHEHLLVYRAHKGECEDKMAGGIALGMVADNSKIVKEVTLPLMKDDVIILYSDGLTEARNMAGEMFGLDRLKQAIQLYAPQYGPEGIVFHVARDFSRFVQDHVQEDDVTLMAIRFSGSKDTIETAVKNSTSWSDMAEPQVPAANDKEKSIL
ncbi:MAG: SpoIIE family protein phosphatase [Candidatus Gracilibacteria bacterium]|jgi:serine phosphatase RsbU (regulator of sigma subunit)